MKEFRYHTTVEWMGNDGSGTSTKTFGRDNELSTPNKPTIIGSAPSEFGGDGVNWAPEDLFVAAVSQCHMLTYLFLCFRAGIVVQSYTDKAVGTLDIDGASGGRFAKVELHPAVTISAGDPSAAEALHAAASASCFVGNSVSCAVTVSGSVQLV
jgi:organic hydroperoxide reductase OsmC/OhrA